MYCSSCGNPIIQGMKYCNRCGSRMVESSEQAKSSLKTDKVVDHLATVICFVAIAGFIASFIIVENSLRAGVSYGVVAAFLLMTLSTIFGISWLLVRQIAKVLDFNHQLRLKAESEPVPVRDTQPQHLEAPLEAMSVTENTTRNFNPVYRKPESQS